MLLFIFYERKLLLFKYVRKKVFLKCVISIYMIYLIPMFNCCVLDEEVVYLKAQTKYAVVEKGVKCGIVFGFENEIPFLLELNIPSANILKVQLEGDCYFFLFPTYYNSFFTTKFSYQSKEVIISLSNKLMVSVDGELICEQNVENLTFSHYEINKNICLIYFKGKRNFVVVLKDKELYFANYYDECNSKKEEKYFMCRMFDSLNHGLVCCVKDGEVEKYPVYLDNEELRLKQAFVPFIFLDCVKAENFKYCNNLLCEDLKMKDEKQIKEFFPSFDYFYPLGKNKFMLAKKNTLAGIYAFEVENNQIINIMNL